MNRRVLKYSVAAALFSAAFLLCNETALAQTFSNKNFNFNDTLYMLNNPFYIQITDDNLIITNNSNIIHKDFDFTDLGDHSLLEAPAQMNFLYKNNGTDLITNSTFPSRKIG